MTADTIAILFLLGYLAIALGLVLWDVRRRRAGWGAWVLNAVNQLYLGLGFHWRANRRCPFPLDGPAIVVANHCSPVDPQIVWKGGGCSGRRLRYIQFLTAKEYFDVPVVGWICRTVEAIPVSRQGNDTGPVRAALRQLEQGAWIGVFPEGRINRHRDTLLPGDTGVAWLALKADVPVYPAFIHNAPRGQTMVQSFFHFQRVTVSYGDAIDLSAYRSRRKSADVLQEVTDLLMSRLAELGDVQYQPAAREPTMESEPAS